MSLTGDPPRDEWWRAHWKGMPEFQQEDLKPFKSIDVNFKSAADMEKFKQLVGGKIYNNQGTLWVWYPPQLWNRWKEHQWVGGDGPKYPVYIISKGRSDTQLTSRYLDRMGVPHRVVIEPQEAEQYAEAVGEDRLLVLPFSNLGRGSIPARNWVWEHSISEGHARHWILDDNIAGFYRLHKNTKHLVVSGAIFLAMEEFADRYENVALAGPHYEFFVPRRDKVPPFTLNTRVYSCILVRNDLDDLRLIDPLAKKDWPPDRRPQLWRGRYNEDTDLSLRALKTGYATVLFNAFLAKKITTMKMKGGNTDELYVGRGRHQMFQDLEKYHADVVKRTEKWGRIHHQVDYSPFQTSAHQKLKLREGVKIPPGADEHGMSLKPLLESEVK